MFYLWWNCPLICNFGGKLGLSREYPKQLFGPKFYSWWNCPLICNFYMDIWGMHGYAPLYLRELLVKQASTRTLRSNTKTLLQIPLTNLKRFGDRAFYAYAPRLWNELPDNTKAADSVQNLKKQLKTLLFRKEFI